MLTITKKSIIKKVVVCFLSLAIVLGITPCSLLLEVTSPFGVIVSAATTFEGEGTEANPYLIKTALDLQELASYVNAGNANFNDKYYRLENNISISSYSAGQGWDPIGSWSSNKSFRGIFDGNSKTISGLYMIGKTDGKGLFGCIDGATIKNLGVIGINCAAPTAYVGGVVGIARGSSNILNTYTTGTVNGAFAVGGIAGYLQDSSIVMNCYSTASVGSTPATSMQIGGIAGSVNDSAKVMNCYATGAITGFSMIGGIVGMNNPDTQVYNNVALNSYVKATDNINKDIYNGRVAGFFATNDRLARNHALSTMGVNGGHAFPTPASTYNVHNNLNGADLTSAQSKTASFWTTTTSQFIAFDTDIWYIVDGQLPTLKEVVSKEIKPNASIDYANERLINLTNGSYALNGVSFTVSNGSCDISQSWFGTTVSIVKKGNGSTSDSDAQLLDVPARPQAPTVSVVNETVDGENDGKITNVSTSMEYRNSNSAEWIACDSTEITGLAPGTYHVRIKAIPNTSFSSEIAFVTVLEGTKLDYNGWVDKNGNWYYYDQNGVQQTGWLNYNGNLYYLNPFMVISDIIVIDGTPHKFNERGEWVGVVVDDGWINMNNSWYFYENGVKRTGWLYYGDNFYYLNPAMVISDTIQIQDQNHTFNERGEWVGWSGGNASSGTWQDAGGLWYYIINGINHTGWLFFENENGGNFYYLNPYMIMSQSIIIDGVMHEFNERGILVGVAANTYDGWVNTDNNWYFYENGVKKNGWLYYEDNFYYLNPAMVISDTVQIQDQNHTFNERGEWIGWSGGNASSGTWQDAGGLWYYIINGVNHTGWLFFENENGGNFYYFNPHMIISESITIDGVIHVFNERGIWQTK